MMEGIGMSLLGGIIGYLVGIGIASYVGPRFTSVDITIPWRIELFLLSIGIALFVGLFSSLYPAYQAANQDPAEALRFI
nr:FtsX-like permease family protein [Anaerobranca gottschalkii]